MRSWLHTLTLLGLVVMPASATPFSAVAPNVTQSAIPLPNERQLHWMDFETIQFMHFSIPTFWDPPKTFLYSANPTYHNCHGTTIDHSNQTEGYYPCLNPDVWNPTDLDPDNWMAASAAMGMKEICLTAKHEGGFALWPSKYTPYSVAASSWYRRQEAMKPGQGNVLKRFVEAANRWGIAICYYLNPTDDGYLVSVANTTAEDMVKREVVESSNTSILTLETMTRNLILTLTTILSTTSIWLNRTLALNLTLALNIRWV